MGRWLILRYLGAPKLAQPMLLSARACGRNLVYPQCFARSDDSAIKVMLQVRSGLLKFIHIPSGYLRKFQSGTFRVRWGSSRHNRKENRPDNSTRLTGSSVYGVWRWTIASSSIFKRDKKKAKLPLRWRQGPPTEQGCPIPFFLSSGEQVFKAGCELLQRVAHRWKQFFSPGAGELSQYNVSSRAPTLRHQRFSRLRSRELTQ